MTREELSTTADVPGMRLLVLHGSRARGDDRKHSGWRTVSGGSCTRSGSRSVRGVDDAGVWWFYEVNPNGQWLWIEHQTGLPISAALAELLQGPS